MLRHGQRWNPRDAPAARLRHYETQLLESLREGVRALSDVGWIRTRAASYELSCAWWDVVEYARKALVTGALMLFPQGSAVQLVIGVLILVAFLVSLVRLAPYKQDNDDLLAVVSQAAVLVALLLGLWLTSLVHEAESERLREGKTESSDGESYNSSKYAHINALLVINSAVPLLLAAALLFRELRTERRHHRRYQHARHHEDITAECTLAATPEDAEPPAAYEPKEGVPTRLLPPEPSRICGAPRWAEPPTARRRRPPNATSTPPGGAVGAGRVHKRRRPSRHPPHRPTHPENESHLLSHDT